MQSFASKLHGMTKDPGGEWVGNAGVHRQVSPLKEGGCFLAGAPRSPSRAIFNTVTSVDNLGAQASQHYDAQRPASVPHSFLYQELCEPFYAIPFWPSTSAPPLDRGLFSKASQQREAGCISKLQVLEEAAASAGQDAAQALRGHVKAYLVALSLKRDQDEWRQLSFERPAMTMTPATSSPDVALLSAHEAQEDDQAAVTRHRIDTKVQAPSATTHITSLPRPGPAQLLPHNTSQQCCHHPSQHPSHLSSSPLFKPEDETKSRAEICVMQDWCTDDGTPLGYVEEDGDDRDDFTPVDDDDDGCDDGAAVSDDDSIVLEVAMRGDRTVAADGSIEAGASSSLSAWEASDLSLFTRLGRPATVRKPRVWFDMSQPQRGLPHVAVPKVERHLQQLLRSFSSNGPEYKSLFQQHVEKLREQHAGGEDEGSVAWVKHMPDSVFAWEEPKWWQFWKTNGRRC